MFAIRGERKGWHKASKWLVRAGVSALVQVETFNDGLVSTDVNAQLPAPMHKFFVNLGVEQMKALIHSKPGSLRHVSKIGAHVCKYVMKTELATLDSKDRVLKDIRSLLSKVVTACYVAQYMNPDSLKVEHSKFERELLDLVGSGGVKPPSQQPGQQSAQRAGLLGLGSRWL